MLEPHNLLNRTDGETQTAPLLLKEVAGHLRSTGITAQAIAELRAIIPQAICLARSGTARFARQSGDGFMDGDGLLEYQKHQCLDCPPPETMLDQWKAEVKAAFESVQRRFDAGEYARVVDDVTSLLEGRAAPVIARLRERFPELPEQPDAKTVFLKLRELRNDMDYYLRR